MWSVAGVISANETLACSFGDNFYANLRHPDISAFVLGRVPDAARNVDVTRSRGGAERERLSVVLCASREIA